MLKKKFFSQKRKLNKYACRGASKNPLIFEDLHCGVNTYNMGWGWGPYCWDYDYYDDDDGPWYEDDEMIKFDHATCTFSFTIWIPDFCSKWSFFSTDPLDELPRRKF